MRLYPGRAGGDATLEVHYHATTLRRAVSEILSSLSRVMELSSFPMDRGLILSTSQTLATAVTGSLDYEPLSRQRSFVGVRDWGCE